MVLADKLYISLSLSQALISRGAIILDTNIGCPARASSQFELFVKIQNICDQDIFYLSSTTKYIYLKKNPPEDPPFSIQEPVSVIFLSLPCLSKPNLSMADRTDSVQFKTGGKRYNFVCAKRTFSLLLSPYFTKFTENLICEEIVLKMGLTILDRKCETMTISGIKTEAVGFIKTTVQCLSDGVQTETVFIKAKVVRDFTKCSYLQ